MPPTLHLRPIRALLALSIAGLLLFLLSPVARAQSGTLGGVVVDRETGETLIGVNVVVEALGTGAATGLDGDYRIAGLPAGTYDVTFSYVGYTPQRITGAEVRAGALTVLDVRLAAEAVAFEGEVVVEAAALLDNEAGLLRQRQRAAAVSDAISAEAIARGGSSNAADAMERVTGASVLGGKYVTVRGLGDRYANTQLNGADIPTADPDRRAVQLDLFPSNLLENIVTLKTFTPDQPGNFAGGLVDIATKSFPDALDLRLSASTGLNAATHFGDTFLTSAGGSRALPAVLADPEIVFPSEVRARTDAELAAVLDRYAGAFQTPMALVHGAAPLNQGYAASLGNRHAVLGNPLGYVVSLTYDRSARYYEDGFTGRYGYSQGSGDGVVLDPELLFRDSQGSAETNWGGIGNVSYRLGSRHEIGINTLYSRSAETTSRFQVGAYPRQFDSTFTFVNRTQLYVERALYSGQLRGKHQLPGLGGAQVEWMGTISATSLDEPDLRFAPNSRRVTPNGTVYSVQSTAFTGPQRFFRTTGEDLVGAQLDVSVPVRLFGRGGEIKLGGRYQRTERTGRERQFRILPASGSPVALEGGADGYGDIGAFLAPEHMGVVDTTGTGRFVFGNYVTENRGTIAKANNYDGYLDVPAAYLMADVGLTRRLRAVVGARFEPTRQAVTSQALDADALQRGDSLFVGGRIAADDVLPSLNLVYALRDDMNLRAAATRTLARPTFQELSPACRFPFVGADLLCGNPDLDRSLITNLDLRWEWFTRPGELLALSGYYKNIEHPIELVLINANGEQTYRNVADAQIYGLEVEARKRLDDVFAPLRDVSVGLNLSLVRSSIALDSTELVLRRAIDPDVADRRALQGQSPFLLNADVAYENAGSGTNVGLYFNVFGRRLARVSFGGVPDVYEQPSPQLDLVASQRVLRDWSVKLSVKNLLDAPYRELYDGRVNGRDAVFQEYERGISFSLGISYSPRFGAAPPNVPAPPDLASPAASSDR